MKKVGYLAIGLLAGAILSTTAGTVTAQVKSLIGSKVAAEYTVNVDGKQVADKAIIVNNKAMVPLRSISDSLGVKIKVDTNTKAIEVTSSSDEIVSSPAPNTSVNAEKEVNKYSGRSEEDLKKSLDTYESRILAPTKEGRTAILAEIEVLENIPVDSKDNKSLEAKKVQLAEYDQMIKDAEAEIGLIKAALASFNG